MAFPQHLYRDPLDQLIQTEAFTCKGCALETRHEAFGTVIRMCSLKNADGTPRKHGRRCNQYNDGRDE